jgi:GT2 family glycosyltransferase
MPGAGGRAGVKVLPRYAYDVSIIVVSFNTRELLRECLRSVMEECARLGEGRRAEVLVVDNGSSDGSPEMVELEFAGSAVPVRLIRSGVNLGFGGANNLALKAAEGRFPVLLNSDAFFHAGALERAIEHMEMSKQTGVGGGRLVGRDGEWQPSARSFHSIGLDAAVLTGMAAKFPRSRFFGGIDRKWAHQSTPADVDWVPGAFWIVRREALRKAGGFDEDFFLYYEEVDLCRRMKQAGFRVTYWPDVVVTHIGGESSKNLKTVTLAEKSSMVVLWRMRSTYLYYRKHHGGQARLVLWMEAGLYGLRWLRNVLSWSEARRERAREAVLLGRLLRQGWRDTRGGRVSPARPW